MEQEERIEEYLKGNLSPLKKVAFEKELATNPNLQRNVEEQRAVMVGVKEYFQEQTLKHFQTLEEQANKQKKYNTTTLIKWSSLLVAASVLFFLWFKNPFQGTSNAILYASYYTTYPNYVDNIERNDSSAQTAYQTAFFAYEQQNYQQAIQIFESLDSKQDPALQFYWGLSLLELEQYTEAILHLEQAYKAPKHRYSDNALWYQALGYLKLEEYKKAKIAFQQLIKDQSTYRVKAADILEALEKLNS